MNILAVETSAKAASCAVCRDGVLIAESFSNTGLTHSQTLLPMIQSMMKRAKLEFSDIGLFAAAAGPGSFTGLRIGVAAVKGMAMAHSAPCAAVSSLEAMAYNLTAFRGVVVPVMDARRSQFYTAAFECKGGNPLRLCPDEALSADDLAEKLSALDRPVMLAGDGAELCFDMLSERLPEILLAPQNLRLQRAFGVAAAALTSAAVSAGELAPVYLRRPQAERLRLGLE